MSANNKVIWSEGLFLQPQHFQQLERYFERYVEARSHGLVPYSWGFTELELERDLLAIGKVGIKRAAGVFPDGTPFRMPDDEPLPEPIDIGAAVRDQVVTLAVPLRSGDAVDVDAEGAAAGTARHHVREWNARNTAAESGDPAVLLVAPLRTRLMLQSEVGGAHSSIPLAHVVECHADRQVVLEERFMPTVLRARTARPLGTFMTELVGLLHQRGEALSGRVAATSRGGAAEIADFLMLQTINRHEPVFTHCATSGAVHPEELYRLFVSAAGELATFMTTGKRLAPFPPYRHEDLRQSFEPVMITLRKLLSEVIEQKVVPIPVHPRKFGISVALVPDPTLYTDAVFVLAARADLQSEELRRSFPKQLRIAPVEQIRDLVNLHLPGIPVSPLPVAPRQLPFHAGFVYFEMNQAHELWAQLKTSGGIALHVAGDFPGLTLECWAIRS